MKPKRSRRRRSKALAPLAEKPRLNLELPAATQLSDEERAEIDRHLGFIRRYKADLRLKLNATEDLLVNGASKAEDRGVVKHLLQKIDRSVVEQALQREPLKSSAAERLRFLGGIVRLDPSLTALLDYLEALTASARAGSVDRREAARAFGLTVKRIDFDRASNAQLARLIDLAMACFSDHDLTQVALGLIANASFRGAIERGRERLSKPAAILFAELEAAESTALRGQPMPNDEAARDLVGRGIDRLLSAPDPVLRSYDEDVRERLAEFALERDPLGQSVRRLIDSIPHHDPRYASLGLIWSEKLLAGGHDDRARAILEQIAQSHPKLPTAREWLTALSWPRLGRVTILPENDPPLRRGFWLDGAAFVWIRVGKPEARAQLEREAEMQVRLTIPGVLPALAFGAGDDGTPYVVIAPRGRPLILDHRQRALSDAMDLAREGLALLRSLALAGVELPDVQRRRFALEGRTGLQLFDLDGARTATKEQADVGHAPLAHAWFRDMLGERTDLPRSLRELTVRRAPLAMLVSALDRARARLAR